MGYMESHQYRTKQKAVYTPYGRTTTIHDQNYNIKAFLGLPQVRIKSPNYNSILDFVD